VEAVGGVIYSETIHFHRKSQIVGLELELLPESKSDHADDDGFQDGN